MTPTDCGTIRASLSAYRDGALSPDKAREAAEHLRDCPDCREELEAIDAVAALVAGAAVTPAPGFEERFQARLRTKRIAEGAWARRGRLARRASLFAATILVALLAGLGPPMLRAARTGSVPINEDQNLNLVLFGTPDLEGAGGSPTGNPPQEIPSGSAGRAR